MVEMLRTPRRLQAVLLDTYRTRMAVQYDNSFLPYGRRLVSVELTPEQVAALRPRTVGVEGGRDIHEEPGEVWLEWGPDTEDGE